MAGLRLIDDPAPGAGAAPDLVSDILIVGGGMVGMTMACACAHGGLSATVVDSLDPARATATGFDGRCSAVAFASQQLLAAIGVWPRLEADAEPILEIRVSDGDSPLFLHFDHRDIGDQPFGFMVENRHMRIALNGVAREHGGITVLAPARVATVARGAGGVLATLEDGRTIAARLLIGADGQQSAVRRAARIRTVNWRYRQTGIVATVTHERPHKGVAQEHFLPSGPFAILPLKGNRSSLVWTERQELAPALMALGREAFEAELAKRFGDYLGRVRSTGPRWSYPLALHNAERYVAPRLALIGDAAHGIHPIAGQGLNLGFRDVAALAEVLVDHTRLGLDFGLSSTLDRYDRWRRTDVLVLAVVTDGLNRLFSNDLAPLRLVRDLGLGAVNRIGPLKRFFMHHARGTVGRLPRLLAGERL